MRWQAQNGRSSTSTTSTSQARTLRQQMLRRACPRWHLSLRKLHRRSRVLRGPRRTAPVSASSLGRTLRRRRRRRKHSSRPMRLQCLHQRGLRPEGQCLLGPRLRCLLRRRRRRLRRQRWPLPRLQAWSSRRLTRCLRDRSRSRRSSHHSSHHSCHHSSCRSKSSYRHSGGSIRSSTNSSSTTTTPRQDQWAAAATTHETAAALLGLPAPTALRFVVAAAAAARFIALAIEAAAVLQVLAMRTRARRLDLVVEATPPLHELGVRATAPPLGRPVMARTRIPHFLAVIAVMPSRLLLLEVAPAPRLPPGTTARAPPGPRMGRQALLLRLAPVAAAAARHLGRTTVAVAPLLELAVAGRPREAAAMVSGAAGAQPWHTHQLSRLESRWPTGLCMRTS